MGEDRKLLTTFIWALIVVIVVGVAQYGFVASAQSRVDRATETFYHSFFAASTAPRTAAGGAAPSIDLANLPKLQAELAVTRNTMMVLGILTLVGACFAVAYRTESKLPSVILAATAWVLAGATTAMVVSRTLASRMNLPQQVTPAGGTWAGGKPGGAPFIIYLLLGLISALLWQAFVPWLIGWFLGSNAGSWIRGVREMGVGGGDSGGGGAAPGLPVASIVPPWASGAGGQSVAGGRAQPDRNLCACGAVNLSSAQACYACGSTLGSSSPADMQPAQQ